MIVLLLLATLTPALGDDLLTVATNNGCGKIANLIQSADLGDALKAAQSVTLFAPSNDAVNQVPSDVLSLLQQNATVLAQVLKFHAVTQVARAADVTNDLLLPTLDASGAQMRMNVYTVNKLVFQSVFPSISVQRNETIVTAEGAQVIKTDLTADNGVVHVIDKVIYPIPSANIPITLTFEKDLGSLAFMLYTANLIEALANDSDSFTVFAPSTAALNKLPGQVYNDLLMNLTSLQQLLLTHVVRGVVFSSGLTNGGMLTNLQGTKLPILVGDDGVKVDRVRVTKADIPASNGVIHIIDSVIMPS